MNRVLDIEDLRFTWPGQDEAVLAIERLTIAPGEKLFLHGPSGSGKSTLLAAIGALVVPQAGRIELCGQDLSSLSRGGRDRFRADHLGVIFQQFNLLPWLDVTANVTLPCRFSRARARRAGDVEAAAARLLEGMDLESSLWHRRADQLSVGQQQRVAAARALIGQPDLVLADEPTSSLDADRRDRFLDLLFERIEEAGSALLFVSHDRQLAVRFDRVVDLPEINRAAMPA
ncbi:MULTISPECIES: ABC transporter ATP-binding protein [unclassified Wenzhouxiangella]|uniref:ABC transporter ATP-binding protein n=1 Tax=unclassified Wenzhouxiangella TaxID=2613841 RepID=UPI000E327ABD|nr:MULTISPECIES: ABC transporter ATP-binding protein [unclassified Wenzhouxiangella]RFF26791.1 ABC transporter ATP-binding protein [Wenzhouxiangella sp. 15181]RFP67685.1 ABC transporter ATP-binding protein [Wenzhouxiangella sp. 15190]